MAEWEVTEFTKISFWALLNIVLVIVLLASSFLVNATGDYSIEAVEYDPWADINDDGKIDMKDIGYLARLFGANGEPLSKAAIMYDSGWIDITNKAGQYINITHNLNSTDILVDITGKVSLEGETHQNHLGLTAYTMGWIRRYSNPGGITEDMVQTSDGGYAIVGLQFSLPPPTNISSWLMKADWTGRLEWNKTYNGIRLASVVQTCDWGYTIAGVSKSSGDYDFCLIRTDVNGNAQWNKSYGKTGIDESIGEVIQTSDGGYAIAGWNGDYVYGPADIWLVKTDENGVMQWNQTYNNDNVDSAFALIQANDGGYLLAGMTGQYSISRDVWMIKTDANGTMQCNKRYGGGDVQSARCVIQTSDGGYALACETYSGYSLFDAWLIKTDSYGNTQWDKVFGGTSSDGIRSLIETVDGCFAIAGETASFGAGGYDAWLIKTDVDGNMQWNKTYGGENHDYAIVVVETGTGEYTLAGHTSSFGSGGYDAWLIKTECEIGITWTNATANSLLLYRGATDAYWNFVRVRIWKVKENP